MSRLTILRRAALLAAVAAAPAALHAQTTTPPKVLYACYVPGSGTVYRIKEADLKQECAKSTHVPFSWTDGNAAALTKTFTVGSAVTTLSATHSGTVVVPCPAGSQLVGGGYRITYFGSGPAPVVATNGPIDVSQPTPTSYWRVEMHNMSTTDDLSFHVHARCAN